MATVSGAPRAPVDRERDEGPLWGGTGIGLVDRLLAQYGRPSGLPGRFVGYTMVRGNPALNAWAVELLDVQRADRTLELGSGPGRAIEAVARQSLAGLVAGVDHSALMVQEAARHNAAAVRAGQVQLCLGAAEAIPYRDGAFDKAFAVNVVHFWPNRRQVLGELRRVLRPGGLLALVLQPRWLKEEGVRPLGLQLVSLVASCGYEQVRLETHALKPISALAVLGIKPATENAPRDDNAYGEPDGS
jgi:SAM-dependent methyltransferase